MTEQTQPYNGQGTYPLLDKEFDECNDDISALLGAVASLDDDAEIEQLLVQYGLDADEPLE